MKKYIINFYLAVMIMIGFASCSDWLDVEQRDQNLEEKQFSTEIGINNVLNGIYMGLKSNTLYGANLSKTTVEHLAHYYYVPEGVTNIEQDRYLRFSDLQNFDYDSDNVKGAFSGLWASAYDLIFNINRFIANVEKSTVISSEKQRLLLGEAYGLRAFIHLDLFRVFGPIYEGNETTLTIPYNDKDNATTQTYLTASQFMDMLFADIELAEEYLEKDPILEVGILNPNDEPGLTSIEIFSKYARNKRMNIVALRALHARALAVANKLDEAAEIARQMTQSPNLIENIDGSNDKAIFRWVIPSNVLYEKERDYTFKTEVLFSFHNAELYSTWTDWTQNNTPGSAYTVGGKFIRDLLFNRSDLDESQGVDKISDIRARQWNAAPEVGANEYTSIRYSKFGSVEGENSMWYMQPLMRMTELFYLILEDDINNGMLDAATDLANSLLVRRGYKENELYTSTATEAELRDFLFREYYREFYSEGQTFFYLKRIASDKIFNSTGSGFMDMDTYDYVVPLPDKEILN